MDSLHEQGGREAPSRRVNAGPAWRWDTLNWIMLLEEELAEQQ
jgi:hypothetical protein